MVQVMAKNSAILMVMANQLTGLKLPILVIQKVSPKNQLNRFFLNSISKNQNLLLVLILKPLRVRNMRCKLPMILVCGILLIRLKGQV